MKKHIRAFVSLLCAAALALGCASCGGAAHSTGKSGGTAVVNLIGQDGASIRTQRVRKALPLSAERDGFACLKTAPYLKMAVFNRYGRDQHGIGLLTGMVVLLAFPPSPLFVSELMILKQTIADGRWWLVTGIMLLLCLVIYFFCSRLLRLCYQPRQDELHPSATDRALSWSALSLLAAAIGLGLWQPAFFRELIDRIASL